MRLLAEPRRRLANDTAVPVDHAKERLPRARK